MNWLLNNDSKTIGQPGKLQIPLKRHQTSMLYRCLMIEKNSYNATEFPYGIMADKAGSGKTAVIISLILADKEIYGKTQNLIVVPQNIHSQWINEFKKFSGDHLQVKSFVEYSDISNLFFDNDVLKESDVLITTLLYYDMIIDILDQTGCNIKRLIFDEIDTLYNVIDNIEKRNNYKLEAIKNDYNNKKLINNEPVIGSKNRIVWFISASFDNAITDTGFKFRNKMIPLNELPYIMCKCDDNFINFELLEPEFKTYKCNDISDDYFNYLSVQQLDYINSLSFQNISSSFTNKISNNSIDAIKNTILDYTLSIKKSKNMIEDLNKNKILTDELKEQLNKSIKEKDFYEKIILLFHNVKCNQKCSDKYKCIIEKIDELTFDNTKIKKIEEIFSNVEKENKVLIFSDFSGSFKIICSLLDKYDIKHTELNGGNIKDIDKSINLYKNKDTQVLLIDSSSEGCGMNLENTTHLIFLHKTSEILYNQIIGRAQRPGRKYQLKIITLINKNEDVSE